MSQQNPPYPDHECEGCELDRALVITPDNKMACHSPEGWVCMKYIEPNAYAQLTEFDKSRRGQVRRGADSTTKEPQL